MSIQPNRITRRRPGRRRLRGLVFVLSAVMVAGAALGSVRLASASTDGVHDDGIMELDGSIDTAGNVCDYNNAPIFPTVPSSTTCTPAADTTAPATAPWDWSSIFNSTSPGTKNPTTGFYPGASAPYSGSPVSSDPGFVNATFQPYNGDLFTKGSKDVGDVSSWSCTQQANPPKDQLANTYGAAFRATSPAGVVQANDTVLNLGIERPSTSGNANAGFWFFQQPVLCDPSTGTFSNGHSNGDLFMVGSFLGGGSNSVLSVFEWQCPHTGPTTACTGAGSLTSIGTDNAPCPQASGDTFCEVVNQNSTVVSGKQQFETWNVNTPWNDGQNGSIPGPGFLELGIDLSAIFRGVSQSTPCFSSFLADTRSSGSSAQAETKDFINHSFPTCFPMTVHKYIDQNLNGAFDSGTDLNGSGWPITVKDSSGNVICTGTTGTDGNLVCSGAGSLTNLQPGPYTVTETQKSGWYNTDPGTGSTCNDSASGSTSPPDSTDVNEAGSISCTVNVGNAASSVQLGNQCLVGLTFKVTGVPAGTTGLYATWSVTSGYDSGKSSSPTGTGNLADVALQPTAAGSTTYTGTSTFPFIQNDKVNWSFYLSPNTANSLPGASGVDLSGGIYSATTGTAACAISSTGAFKASSIQATKFKDIYGTGLSNTGTVPSGDTGLGGVNFDLVALSSSTPLSGSALTTALGTTCAANTTQTGCVYGTATSAASTGLINFTGVNPGYYQLHEVVPTGWRQTAPVSSGSAVDFVAQVKLGDTTDTKDVNGTVLDFLDTPTYDFSMSFNSDANLPGTTTPATHGSISCSPNPSTSTGSGTGGYTSGIQQGASATYQCTLTVTDP